jgi:hypothetical protein
MPQMIGILQQLIGGDEVFLNHVGALQPNT